MAEPKTTDPIDDPEADEEFERRPWLTFKRTMWLGLGASVVWGAGVLFGRWQQWWDEEGAGTFGDSFAPLLGFLTVAALAAAIDSVRMQRNELRLQRREIRLQRRELELTRDEMRAQRMAAEEQAQHIKQSNELASEGHRISEQSNEIALRAQWLELQQAVMAHEVAYEAATGAALDGSGRAVAGEDAIDARAHVIVERLDALAEIQKVVIRDLNELRARRKR